eukprot:95358-Rhodomonas_salina.2
MRVCNALLEFRPSHGCSKSAPCGVLKDDRATTSRTATLQARAWTVRWCRGSGVLRDSADHDTPQQCYSRRKRVQGSPSHSTYFT